MSHRDKKAMCPKRWLKWKYIHLSPEQALPAGESEQTVPHQHLIEMQWDFSVTFVPQAGKLGTASSCCGVSLSILVSCLCQCGIRRLSLGLGALIVFEIFKGKEGCHLFKWHSGLGKECF